MPQGPQVATPGALKLGRLGPAGQVSNVETWPTPEAERSNFGPQMPRSPFSDPVWPIFPQAPRGGGASRRPGPLLCGALFPALFGSFPPLPGLFEAARHRAHLQEALELLPLLDAAGGRVLERAQDHPCDGPVLPDTMHLGPDTHLPPKIPCRSTRPSVARAHVQAGWRASPATGGVGGWAGGHGWVGGGHAGGHGWAGGTWAGWGWRGGGAGDGASGGRGRGCGVAGAGGEGLGRKRKRGGSWERAGGRGKLRTR